MTCPKLENLHKDHRSDMVTESPPTEARLQAESCRKRLARLEGKGSYKKYIQ
jgi:hypothetical protein